MKQAIAFSGGKDSWSLLWLYEKDLATMPVLWVNTGKAYPETLAMVEKAKRMCGNFVEISSDQEEHIRRYGIPADVVPVNWTNMGQSMTSPKPIKIQPWISCCHGNIAAPIIAKAVELGVQQIISGQRADENHRAPYGSGAMAEGVEHLFPIYSWTRADVLTYLATKMEIPPHFAIAHSSLDCYDCTAYTKASKDRIAFTKERYPMFHARYLEKKGKLDAALMEALNG